MKTTLACLLLASASLGLAPSAHAQDNVLNVYSARHYKSDQLLYDAFTKETGVQIRRIEAGDEALLERLRNEGRNSPADIVLLADAARLWKAQVEGLFQPVKSPLLDARIPVAMRGKDDGSGSEWFGFSARARMIVYNKDRVDAALVQNYEDLARPELAGKICTRSGTHPYMLSLIGAMAEHLGEAKAEQWASRVVANFARKPRGGDTDQIRAVASGECGVALTNSYYLVRLMRSDRAEDREAVARIGAVWPNQSGVGTHVNVSGAGVAKYAPHHAEAVRFLEFLASDEAQKHFAEENNEWPVVKSVKVRNEKLDSLGPFKADTLPVASIGRAQVTASKIIDRVGWR